MIKMWPKSGCGQPGGRFAVIFSSSAGGGSARAFLPPFAGGRRPLTEAAGGRA